MSQEVSNYAAEFTVTIKIVSIMKQKRTYVKPAMRTVELRQQCRILAGSDPMRSSSAAMNVTYEEEEI